MVNINETIRYIAVEGPIGVGKTSLARRLADTLQAELVLENAEENPFLERFYRDPRTAALPTQLSFLFQRSQKLQALQQADLFAPARVADFIFEKDLLFAELTLDDDELNLYHEVYRRLKPSSPRPDLVIYLQAPVDILLSRIERRGIGYERAIQRDYLVRVAELYTRFFHHYDVTRLLIVNTSGINLAESDQHYALLLEHIQTLKGGRHYFNPAGVG